MPDPQETQTPLEIPTVIAPVSTLLGVTSGIVSTIGLTSNIKTLNDFILVVSRLFAGLLGLLGLRRKSRPWGTVYDSVTKRPLDPAYVVAIGKDGESGSAITDLDGRFGFLLPDGEYELGANKTNYSFPSKSLAGKSKDELYENLYFGGKFSVTSGEITARDIPLDQDNFDWNEFTKNKEKMFKVYSKNSKIKKIVFDGIYLAGFVITLIACIMSPVVLNIVLLMLYAVIFLLQTLWRRRRKAHSVINKTTRQPLSFAVVKFYLAELGQEMKRVVADEYGRFYALISPGIYYYTVEARQNDGSYSLVYKSPPSKLKTGTLGGDILIN